MTRPPSSVDRVSSPLIFPLLSLLLCAALLHARPAQGACEATAGSLPVAGTSLCVVDDPVPLVTADGSARLSPAEFTAGVDAAGKTALAATLFDAWGSGFTLAVHMGEYDDYFSPSASGPATLDAMLQSGAVDWEYSGDLDSARDTPDNYHPSDVLGSQPSEPAIARVNAADTRTRLSFLGTPVADSLFSGGCCFDQLSDTTEEWGLAYRALVYPVAPDTASDAARLVSLTVSDAPGLPSFTPDNRFFSSNVNGGVAEVTVSATGPAGSTIRIVPHGLTEAEPVGEAGALSARTVRLRAGPYVAGAGEIALTAFTIVSRSASRVVEAAYTVQLRHNTAVACVPERCLNGGTCAGGGATECVCPSGYAGTECERTVVPAGTLPAHHRRLLRVGHGPGHADAAKTCAAHGFAGLCPAAVVCPAGGSPAPEFAAFSLGDGFRKEIVPVLDEAGFSANDYVTLTAHAGLAVCDRLSASVSVSDLADIAATPVTSPMPRQEQRDFVMCCSFDDASTVRAESITLLADGGPAEVGTFLPDSAPTPDTDTYFMDLTETGDAEYGVMAEWDAVVYSATINTPDGPDAEPGTEYVTELVEDDTGVSAAYTLTLTQRHTGASRNYTFHVVQCPEVGGPPSEYNTTTGQCDPAACWFTGSTECEDVCVEDPDGPAPYYTCECATPGAYLASDAKSCTGCVPDTMSARLGALDGVDGGRCVVFDYSDIVAMVDGGTAVTAASFVDGADGGPSHVIARCDQFDALGENFVLAVAMGDTFDFYALSTATRAALAGGGTYCTLVAGPAGSHAWTVNPSDSLLSLVPGTQSSSVTDGRLLGSIEPFVNDVVRAFINPSDLRTVLPYLGGPGETGGCCHASYSDSSAWGRSYEAYLLPTPAEFATHDVSLVSLSVSFPGDTGGAGGALDVSGSMASFAVDAPAGAVTITVTALATDVDASIRVARTFAGVPAGSGAQGSATVTLALASGQGPTAVLVAVRSASRVHERLFTVVVRHPANETVSCNAGMTSACRNGGTCPGVARAACECPAGTAGAECERTLGDTGGADGLYARAWFDAGHGVSYDSATEVCQAVGFTGVCKRAEVCPDGGAPPSDYGLLGRGSRAPDMVPVRGADKDFASMLPNVPFPGRAQCSLLTDFVSPVPFFFMAATGDNTPYPIQYVRGLFGCCSYEGEEVLDGMSAADGSPGVEPAFTDGQSIYSVPVSPADSPDEVRVALSFAAAGLTVTVEGAGASVTNSSAGLVVFSPGAFEAGEARLRNYTVRVDAGLGGPGREYTVQVEWCPAGASSVEAGCVAAACDPNPCGEACEVSGADPRGFVCSCSGGQVVDPEDGVSCSAPPDETPPCSANGTNTCEQVCVEDAGEPRGYTCACERGFDPVGDACAAHATRLEVAAVTGTAPGDPAVVLPQASVQLEAVVLVDGYSYRWEAAGAGVDLDELFARGLATTVPRTALGGENLLFSPGALPPGAAINFTVRAYAPGIEPDEGAEATFEQTFAVSTAGAPSGGTCSASAGDAAAAAASTVFTLSCAGWSDASAPPLAYSFEVLGLATPAPNGTASLARTLPAGAPLTVVARVNNALGVFAEHSFDVAVAPAPAGDTLASATTFAASFVSGALASAASSGSPAAVAAEAGTLASVVGGAVTEASLAAEGPTQEEREAVAEVVADAVADIAAAAAAADPLSPEGAAVLQSLADVVASAGEGGADAATLAEAQAAMSEVLGRALATVAGGGDAGGSEAARGLATASLSLVEVLAKGQEAVAAGTAVDAGSRTAAEVSAEAQATQAALREAVAALTPLVLDQFDEESGGTVTLCGGGGGDDDGNESRLCVQFTRTPAGERTFSGNSRLPAFDEPVDVSEALQLFNTLAGEPANKPGSTILAVVLSVTVYDTGTGTARAVSGLSGDNRAFLVIPLPDNSTDDEDAVECVFYDIAGGRWSSDGCARADAGAEVAGQITCACTHLTDFAPSAPKFTPLTAEDFSSITLANIVRYPTVPLVLFGVTLLYIALLVYAVKLDAEYEEKYLGLVRRLARSSSATGEVGAPEQFDASSSSSSPSSAEDGSAVATAVAAAAAAADGDGGDASARRRQKRRRRRRKRQRLAEIAIAHEERRRRLAAEQEAAVAATAAASTALPDDTLAAGATREGGSLSSSSSSVGGGPQTARSMALRSAAQSAAAAAQHNARAGASRQPPRGQFYQSAMAAAMQFSDDDEGSDGGGGDIETGGAPAAGATPRGTLYEDDIAVQFSDNDESDDGGGTGAAGNTGADVAHSDMRSVQSAYEGVEMARVNKHRRKHRRKRRRKRSRRDREGTPAAAGEAGERRDEMQKRKSWRESRSKLTVKFVDRAREMHLWASVRFRHPRDRVSSAERASVLYALVLGSMCVSAALFGSGQGLFSDMATSVVSSLMMLPSTALLLYLFRGGSCDSRVPPKERYLEYLAGGHCPRRGKALGWATWTLLCAASIVIALAYAMRFERVGQETSGDSEFQPIIGTSSVTARWCAAEGVSLFFDILVWRPVIILIVATLSERASTCASALSTLLGA